jgi:hypothetical protein
MLDQLWQTYASLGVVSAVLWALPATRFWGSAFLPDGTTRVMIGIGTCALLSGALVWLSVRMVERKQF